MKNETETNPVPFCPSSQAFPPNVADGVQAMRMEGAGAIYRSSGEIRRFAFTLIELLVVIGIIVTLIAILLPSLAKARRQGRTTVCLTHLRALGQALQTYYSVYSPPLLCHNLQGRVDFFAWDYVLFGGGLSDTEYYNNPSATVAGNKVMVCPETPGPPDPRRFGGSGTAHLPWFDNNRSGSYAINAYLYDDQLNRPAGSYRVPVSRNGSTIPVFLDATTHLLIASEDQPVPTNLEDSVSAATGDSLTSDCINRHNMAVNVSFFDGHVETVKLGNLWTLKWAADWSRTVPAVVPGK